MIGWIQRNFLVLVIAAAAMLALLLPGPGLAVQGWGLIPAAIIGVFFCQGAGVDARRFGAWRSYAALVLWGGVTAFVVTPLLGVGATWLLGWSMELTVGFLLICCMGPTLVSGIVLAVQAGGEREAAVLLTILLNLVAVVTIPFSLVLFVDAGGSIDRWSLLITLLLLVLLPALIGQALRWRWSQLAEQRALLKYLPVLLLGLTIYIAMSARSEDLLGMSGWQLAAMVPPAVVVHLLVLVLTLIGALLILRQDRARSTAAAVVCSQKTIPVAIAVWSTELASSYPLAIIPAIVFHFAQIAVDGLLAGWWSRRLMTRAKTGHTDPGSFS